MASHQSAAEDPSPVLRVQDACVETEETLLAPVSLEVIAGEIVALRGANGSGKTTLLRCVTGELTATSGTVHVAGHTPDPRRRRFRSAVAALTAPVPLDRDLTVAEACRFVALTWTSEQQTAERTSAGVLAAFGIEHLAGRFPHELSSGQRQLAELAMVLARPFDLLVLDEPEQRLDADRVARVADVLAGLSARGAAVLMATHSPVLAEQTADRAVHVGA